MAIRLVLPATGSLAMSAAQFVLVFVLLQRLSVTEFGALAFLLVVHQFLIGCWSALFAAPLLAIVSSSDMGRDGALPPAMFGAALAAMPVAFLVVMAIALANGFDAPSAIGFAGFSALMLTRYFARAWYLAQGHRARVIASDYAYALMLGGLAIVCLVRSQVSLRFAVLGQPLTALPAVALLVPGVAAWGGLGTALRQIGGYRGVWRRDARWSLTGVMAGEMTANIHAYLVTGLFGAAAYAPIAATALFVRPVLVLINPLVDFERMRMAGAIARRDWAGLRHQHAVLAGTILATWGATAAVAVAIIVLGGTAVLHNKVPFPWLWLASTLWFVIALMRGLHAAEGAVLQGAGQFRVLARLALITAGLSAVAAVLAALVGGPIWSMAGVAIGEGTYVVLLVQHRRRFIAVASDSRGGLAHVC